MQLGDNPLFEKLAVVVRRFGLGVGAALLSGLLLVAAGFAGILFSLLFKGNIDWGSVLIVLLVVALIAPFVSWVLFNVIVSLELAEQRLSSLQHIDDLTQVFNHRHITTMTQHELERTKRYGHHFSLLMVSVDDFDEIAENNSNDARDRLLRTVATTTAKHIRPIDVLARYGVAEFMILQPQSDRNDASALAKRLCEIMAQTPVVAGAEVIEFTISVGITTCKEAALPAEPLFYRAKEALFDAQEMGISKIAVR